MESLIEDLLLYARAGKARTDYQPTDLRALLHGIVTLQPPPAGFTLDLALDVPVFPAARTPLETVLRNLIGNAIKHHDRAIGRIEVAARPDASHVLITVTDDGPGIPAQAFQRIFKLFQTLTSSRRGQSGIGLALCKRLVETHGGRIDVVSPVADGRGACFRVWWPRYQRRTSDE